MADIMIIGALAVIIFLILRGNFRKARSGKCAGGCAGCPGCGSCADIHGEKDALHNS